MNVALDTNAYTDLARGTGTAGSATAQATSITIPFMVLAELRAGFAVGSKSVQNEAILRTFLAKPQVHVLYPDENTVAHYAAIYRDLRQRGKAIPVGDLWIAALVLQHDLDLCTRDAHFDLLPQIRRV